jgi:PKD repeat protein
MALPPGQNSVVAAIADRAGNTGRDSISFTVRPLPPKVIITWPGQDTVLNITPLSVQYTINGSARSKSISLSEGLNQIFIDTTDQWGNRGADTVQVTLDTKPPVIQITFLPDNAYLNTRQPIISITYSDALSGVRLNSLQILVNGIDRTTLFEKTPSGASWAVPADLALAEGANTVWARIEDRAANTITDSLRFQILTTRPHAVPEAYPDSGPAPLTVRFRTIVEDPRSTINYYRWDFNADGTWDAQSQVARDYSYAYATAGIYHPFLEITNMLGEKDTAKLRIVAAAPPPSAVFQATPASGAAPLTVTFTGWGETKDGYIKFLEWDFNGDGIYDTLLQLVGDTTTGAYYDFETGPQGWTSGGTSGSFGLSSKTIDTANIIPGLQQQWMETDAQSPFYSTGLSHF